MTKERKDDHPFFDNQAGCRKTAWSTPQHLSENDWYVANALIESAEGGLVMFQDYLLSLSGEERFRLFNHTLGWPEGLSYTRNTDYIVLTFYPGFMRHTLLNLKKACTNHEKELNQ